MVVQEKHIKIHGKDDFDRVIKNLKFVDEYRKKKGKKIKIYVSMVETFANSKRNRNFKKNSRKIILMNGI